MPYWAKTPPKVVPRVVLKDEGEGGEEEEEKCDFQPPNLENGSGCRGKKFGHSSISMRSAPFRLRTPLRGAARAPQQPIVRLEPRLGSAHGTLDLLRVVVHGGETLRYASKEQYPNAVSNSDGIMAA